ncbi:MAG: alpha/beta hydrolase [Salinivirgaceae bacterium]
MRKQLQLVFASIILLLLPYLQFGQVPTLGTTSSFAIFTVADNLDNIGAADSAGDIGSFTDVPTELPGTGIVTGTIYSEGTPILATADADEFNAWDNYDSQLTEVEQVFNNYLAKRGFLKLYDSTLNNWDFEFKSQFIATKYGKTHVISAGNDTMPVIVLLHGFSGSSLIWYKTIKELHKNYKIYAIDILGDANRSEMKVPMEKSNDWTLWLKDICDSLKISHATFVGHSYGGYQSLLFTISYPKIVDKCFLIAPYPGLCEPNLNYSLNYFSMMISPSREKAMNFLQLCVAKDFVIEKSYSDIILLAFENSNPIVPFDNYRISNKLLNSITRPVILFVGDHNNLYYPYQKVAKRINKNIPNCRTVLIKNCGHSPVIEKPEYINEQIDMFVKGE